MELYSNSKVQNVFELNLVSEILYLLPKTKITKKSLKLMDDFVWTIFDLS